MTERKGRHLSIVIPCYNESEVLPLLFERLTQVLPTLDMDSEVIFVDDGSQDSTRDILREFTQKNSRFTVVILSKNFGHQIALTAGLDFASGDAVAVLDADLQDPPELIQEMIKLWRQGWDVVYGKRTARHGDTWLKKITASLFYWVVRKLSGERIPSNVGDFRLMDKKVVDSLKKMPERFRFIRGMVVWTGFKQCPLPYERNTRPKGKTKYPLARMILFAFDAIFSFSVVPLRIATFTGLVIMSVAVFLSLRTLYLKIFLDSIIPGFTALYVMTLMIGGLILIVLGILGEYMGRIYVEIKGRPLYLIREIFGPKEI